MHVPFRARCMRRLFLDSPESHREGRREKEGEREKREKAEKNILFVQATGYPGTRLNHVIPKFVVMSGDLNQSNFMSMPVGIRKETQT